MRAVSRHLLIPVSLAFCTVLTVRARVRVCGAGARMQRRHGCIHALLRLCSVILLHVCVSARSSRFDCAYVHAVCHRRAGVAHLTVHMSMQFLRLHTANHIDDERRQPCGSVRVLLHLYTRHSAPCLHVVHYVHRHPLLIIHYSVCARPSLRHGTLLLSRVHSSFLAIHIVCGLSLTFRSSLQSFFRPC